MCRWGIIGLVLETHLLWSDKAYSFLCPTQRVSHAFARWAKTWFPFPLHDNSFASVLLSDRRTGIKEKSKTVENNLTSKWIWGTRVPCSCFFNMTSHAGIQKSLFAWWSVLHWLTWSGINYLNYNTITLMCWVAGRYENHSFEGRFSCVPPECLPGAAAQTKGAVSPAQTR